MSLMQFLEMLIKKIWNLIPAELWLCASVGILIFCFLESDFYRDNYKRPTWNFHEEQGYDTLESDIELKTGKAIVAPKIIVKYDNIVVFIIDVYAYYNINVAELGRDGEGQMKLFRFEVEEEQKEKMEVLVKEFEGLLRGNVESETQSEVRLLEVYEAKVIHIQTQNVKANKEKGQYLYITDSLEREVQEKEHILWSTEYNINLDEYAANRPIYENVDLLKLIDICVEKIKLQK